MTFLTRRVLLVAALAILVVLPATTAYAQNAPNSRAHVSSVSDAHTIPLPLDFSPSNAETTGDTGAANTKTTAPCDVTYCIGCAADNASHCVSCEHGLIPTSKGTCYFTDGSCFTTGCAQCEYEDNFKCHTCLNGYSKTAVGGCAPDPSGVSGMPTTTNTTTTEAPTTTNTTTPATCNVTYCIGCAADNASHCVSCERGLIPTSKGTCYFTDGSCFTDGCAKCEYEDNFKCHTCFDGYSKTAVGGCARGPSGVSGMPSLVGAAAVCVSAMVLGI